MFCRRREMCREELGIVFFRREPHDPSTYMFIHGAITAVARCRLGLSLVLEERPPWRPASESLKHEAPERPVVRLDAVPRLVDLLRCGVLWSAADGASRLLLARAGALAFGGVRVSVF